PPAPPDPLRRAKPAQFGQSRRKIAAAGRCPAPSERSVLSMTVQLVFPRARTLALLLAAAVVAALAVAAVAPRSTATNAGAAAAGVVHIELKITGHKPGALKGDR